MGKRSLGAGSTQRAVTRRLDDEIQARGLSLRSLAATLGISHTRLAYVMRGERAMTIDEFENACHALGLTGWRLLREVTEDAPSTPDLWGLAAQDEPGIDEDNLYA